MVDVRILDKGANIPLTAGNPLLHEIVVGFGWDVVPTNGPVPELVPSAIMCDAKGQAVSVDHFVFFNQLSSPDDSVQYIVGDDAEQIEIDVNLVPENVEKIVFIVYTDPDVRKPGSFGSVRNAYMRVADKENTDIARFNLSESDHNINAMMFGEIYRYKGSWKFRALGQGYTSGLVGVTKDFGLSL
jgi:tellurium resistance protein TerD